MEREVSQKWKRFLWLVPVLACGVIIYFLIAKKQSAPISPPDLSDFPPKWKEITRVDENYMKIKPCGRGINGFCLDSMPDGYYLEHTGTGFYLTGKVIRFDPNPEGRYSIEVEFTGSDGESSRMGKYEVRFLEGNQNIAAWTLDGKPVALMAAEDMYKAFKLEFDECKAAAETSGWYYGNVGNMADSTLQGLLRKVERRSNTVFLGITDTAHFRLRGDICVEHPDWAAICFAADSVAAGPFTLLCVRREPLWITLTLEATGEYLAGLPDTAIAGPVEGEEIVFFSNRRGSHYSQYPAMLNASSASLKIIPVRVDYQKPVGCDTVWKKSELLWNGAGTSLVIDMAKYTVTTDPECVETAVKDSLLHWLWDETAKGFLLKPF